jgi:drug/metabolite transporter (DMT)-like permease
MWTEIPSNLRKDLFLRVLNGLILMVIIYTSIKEFPLVYVSLVSNTTPIVTAVASYMIFKVKLSKIDIVVLIISFIGVLLLIFGEPAKVINNEEDVMQSV